MFMINSTKNSTNLLSLSLVLCFAYSSGINDNFILPASGVPLIMYPAFCGKACAGSNDGTV